ncbi:hypothetical protein ACFO1B_20625 [Dactylosporangium siamense]|uniref:Uncharacterized protein n=1 Tax=Dactylosporangium siamense TaxID=685454 RepID=A0A919PL83_9ACTN|nr:hypothetical protein [Dactylosporangium siamense]GIG46860.1 hypothetical protein Dsi01nite_049010 [Dactylosporangium siamense]
MSDSLAPDIAEQLRELDGGRPAGVTALLVAAAGPALPAELAGEESALRAFRLARRARRKRRRAGLIAGVAVVVASLGGTGYAAAGDHLPGPVQHTVESLFDGQDAAPSTVPGAAGRPATAPAPAPPASWSPPGRVEALCRAWEAARADPHAAQVTGEDRRALAHAASGDTGINDFCRAVLGTPYVTTATAANGRQGTAKPGNADPGGGPNRTHPVKPSHP